MDSFEIKSEEGDESDYLVVRLPPKTEQAVKDSEGLFCKPFYQQSLEGSSSESKDCSLNSEPTRDEKEKAVWLDKHCRLLIELFKEESPNVGKTFEMKTKQKLWQRIAERMQEQGSYFTASQVQGKWNTFERSFFKRRKENKPCLYEKDLSKLLLKGRSHRGGGRTESLYPDAQSPLSSNASESSSSEDDIESDISDEPSPQSKMMMKELRMLKEEFVKDRKAKRKYQHAELKAYGERTAVLEKQMKLEHRFWKELMDSRNKNA